MDSKQLTVGSNGGSQTAAKSNLQAPTGAGITGTNSSRVQTGTTQNLLTSTTGVALRNQAPTTVSLDTKTQTQAQSKASPEPTKQADTNPFLFGMTALFVLIGLVLLWNTIRSAKNTTDY